MKQIELSPELIDYIFKYCGKYFWEKELKAHWNLRALIQSEGSNIAMYKVLQHNEFISADPEILDLIKDGFEVYKIRVATRIFKQYKEELDLNLCPKCGKIARTPRAKQCRFCFYSWGLSEK